MEEETSMMIIHALIILVALCRIANAAVQDGAYEWLDPKCLPNNRASTAESIMCDDEHIIIENNSFFMHTSPVILKKGRKFYSSSDGGFSYYAGPIKRGVTNDSAVFSLVRCDYCVPTNSVFDSVTGYNHPIPYKFKVELVQKKREISPLATGFIVRNQKSQISAAMISQWTAPFFGVQ
ncbi:MAG TPA: hypothetical protein PKO15_11595 [Fibrobacteria bacterium]|nr:hypothetical protein [Fibrobacteria bacterium]